MDSGGCGVAEPTEIVHPDSFADPRYRFVVDYAVMNAEIGTTWGQPSRGQTAPRYEVVAHCLKGRAINEFDASGLAVVEGVPFDERCLRATRVDPISAHAYPVASNSYILTGTHLDGPEGLLGGWRKQANLAGVIPDGFNTPHLSLPSRRSEISLPRK